MATLMVNQVMMFEMYSRTTYNEHVVTCRLVVSQNSGPQIIISTTHSNKHSITFAFPSWLEKPPHLNDKHPNDLREGHEFAPGATEEQRSRRPWDLQGAATRATTRHCGHAFSHSVALLVGVVGLVNRSMI